MSYSSLSQFDRRISFGSHWLLIETTIDLIKSRHIERFKRSLKRSQKVKDWPCRSLGQRATWCVECRYSCRGSPLCTRSLSWSSSYKNRKTNIMCFFIWYKGPTLFHPINDLRTLLEHSVTGKDSLIRLQ